MLFGRFEFLILPLNLKLYKKNFTKDWIENNFTCFTSFRLFQWWVSLCHTICCFDLTLFIIGHDNKKINNLGKSFSVITTPINTIRRPGNVKRHLKEIILMTPSVCWITFQVQKCQTLKLGQKWLNVTRAKTKEKWLTGASLSQFLIG